MATRYLKRLLYNLKTGNKEVSTKLPLNRYSNGFAYTYISMYKLYAATFAHVTNKTATDTSHKKDGTSFLFFEQTGMIKLVTCITLGWPKTTPATTPFLNSVRLQPNRELQMASRNEIFVHLKKVRNRSSICSDHHSDWKMKRPC